LVASASCLTSDEYDDIYFEIFKDIRTQPSKASTIVRLSFHDCVGGCDGCINMDNDSNAGLQTAIDIMEDTYATVTATVSISAELIFGPLGVELPLITEWKECPIIEIMTVPKLGEPSLKPGLVNFPPSNMGERIAILLLIQLMNMNFQVLTITLLR